MQPASFLSAFSSRFSFPAPERLLLVIISEQRMYEIEEGRVRQEFRVSTAAKGSGNLSGSEQTPLGLHSIAEKHGAGLPSGAVLVSRVFTGEIAGVAHHPGRDLISSRILWLRGEEAGYNQGLDEQGRLVDSYARYIYLHGTPEEALLGQPASHGCIRMANADIIALFERVKTGDWVWILEEAPD